MQLLNIVLSIFFLRFGPYSRHALLLLSRLPQKVFRGLRRVGKAAWLGALLLPVLTARPQSDEPSPFRAVPTTIVSNGAACLSVAFSVPAHHHIYADRVAFEWNGAPVAVRLPAANRISDKFSHGEKLAFEKDFSVVIPWPDRRPDNLALAVTFQGCSETECYFPETHEWEVRADNSIVSREDAAGDEPGRLAADGEWMNGFRVAGRASGFLGSATFLRFLDESQGATPAAGDKLARLAQVGLAATLGLILLGGLALNLTPCVLPMIPINLAILGIGARSGDRRRGFLLGAVYGTGMALAYGVLGLVVVLTGSKFGTLNSSAWFNLAIAAVFIVLGLAMFDRVAIDFSRFQAAGGQGRSSRGTFLTAGIMGSVSALLAGACVAPVVISVLLLAATFYQRGSLLGLSLPFVLGLGMALPWPFAGAGLSFLPKPGAWMTRVKHGFGVVIFGFALWYGWLGWSLSGLGPSGTLRVAARSNSVEDLRSALNQSRATGRPVLVDFWASWCKNCEAMEHATFSNGTVRQRLKKDFIFVRFQAERLNEPALKPVLDKFGVLGLPTYIVLRPESRNSGYAQTAAAANH